MRKFVDICVFGCKKYNFKKATCSSGVNPLTAKLLYFMIWVLSGLHESLLPRSLHCEAAMNVLVTR